MASPDFKGLLFSLSQKLNQQEIDKFVTTHNLPSELKNKPPSFVLRYLELNGQVTPSSLDWLKTAMKEIGKPDLYKEIKVFLKAEKKIRKRPTSSGASPQSEVTFDIAECQAIQVDETLRAMEATVKASDAKGIEELYNEAKKLAENLVQVVKRMNSLVRCPSPPEQNTPNKTNTLPRRSSCRNPSVSPSTTPPSATPIVRSNRDGSLSEKRSHPPPPTQPPLPVAPFQHANDSGDEDPMHDYDLPDNFVQGVNGAAAPRDVVGSLTLDRAARGLTATQESAPRDVGSLTLDRARGLNATQESARRNKFLGGGKVNPPPVKEKTRKASAPNTITSQALLGFSRPQSDESVFGTSPQSSKEIDQIRKSLRKTIKKYDTGSPSGNTAHPFHPISTARAVESVHMVDHSDSVDSTEDSGFDEFYPVTKTSTAPAPTPKPKPRLQMNSDADYVNCVSPQSHCQDLCSSEVIEEDAHDYINVENFVM